MEYIINFFWSSISYLIFLGIPALIVYFNYLSAKNFRDRMVTLAKEFNLEYKIAKADNIILKILRKNNLMSANTLESIQSFFDMFAKGSILGNYDNNFAEIQNVIRGSGKSQTVYTIISMRVKQRLPFNFEITNQGMVEGFIIKLFNMEDIIIGDEQFDKTFVIKGNNPEAIKKFFRNPDVQKPTYELMRESEFTIRPDGIHYEKRGIITDVLIYKNLLSKMSGACNKMYSSELSNFE